MITKTKTAYKIGFSSSLEKYTFSGYNECAKWKFLEEEAEVLQRAFLRGYSEGLKLKKQVRKDNLAASYNSRDKA